LNKYVRIGIDWTKNNRKELVIWESCGSGHCEKEYILIFSTEFQDFRFIRLYNNYWEDAMHYNENGVVFDVLNDVKVNYNFKQTKLYLDFPKFLLSDGFSYFDEFVGNYYRLNPD
jgi:hypothetical protein